MCLNRLIPFSFLLLFLTLSSSLFAGQGVPPHQWDASVLPLQKVERVALPEINPDVLLANDAKDNTPGPIHFAVPIAVDLTPENAGTWDTLDDGSRVWRLRFQVPGSTDLNFGFTEYRMPQGATLLIYSESRDYFQGPYGAQDNKEHGQLWTPVVPGESAVIELYLPAGTAGQVKLRLTQVGAGYRDLFKLKPQGKQGSCNIDTICPQGDPWRNEIRSVGRISIGGTGLCSGTLIMDAESSFRSFFLTANHCGLDSLNAPSTVVYWNFESPSCGLLSGGSLGDNQTGATFRAARFDVDFALIELDQTPNPDFAVFYAGWDRSAAAPSGSVSIHHPSADEKAISFNNDPLATVNSCIGTGGNNTHWTMNWEAGTTEPGSSGGGLWSPDNHKLVGFLSGGASSCGNPSGTDCYGKFSVAWDGVSSSSRLRDWLDPANTGTVMVDGSNLPVIPAPKPVNDDFTDSIVIANDSGQITGSSIAATLETGEPNHAGVSPGASVWWHWTAPRSGAVIIDTFGSNFNTVLAVYTGLSVDHLDFVAANNDYKSTEITSVVMFQAVAGTTYHIAVAGVGAEAGKVVLNWTLSSLDHYLLYETRPLGPKLPTFGPVQLLDRFGSRNFNVSKGKRLGLPADKNGEGINDDMVDLFEYPVKPSKGKPKFQKVRNVHVINQCNDLVLEVVKPRSVLLPSNNSLFAQPTDLATNDIDHFLCYDAKVQKKDESGRLLPKFPKRIQAVVGDQLQTRRYDLTKITRFCNPVDKSGNPVILSGKQKGTPFSISPAAIHNPNAHLLCYQAKVATRLIEQNGCGPIDANRGTAIKPPQARHSPVTAFVINQFESGAFYTIKPKELCIPTFKTH